MAVCFKKVDIYDQSVAEHIRDQNVKQSDRRQSDLKAAVKRIDQIFRMYS
jgi:hypothetical protein